MHRSAWVTRGAALTVAVVLAACAGSDGVSRGAGRVGVDGLSGSRSGVLGVNVDPKNSAATPSPADVLELGATRLRMEFKVDYDAALSADDELAAAFDAYDAVIGAYASAGISVLLLVDYATLGEERSGAHASDGYRGDFAARAGAIASHYAGAVDHFEIWNEEDLCAGDYCPFLPADVYAGILGASAEAIHAAAPGALVASGGTASGDWASYTSDVVAALGDGWGEVDAVGAHPYTFWPAASGLGGNVLENQLGALHDIGDRPIWFTEWGDGGSQDDAERAYFAFFADTSIVESADVGEAYLFAWSDAMHDLPDAFGLFDRAGQKKPEWTTFHDAAFGAGDGDGETSETSDSPPAAETSETAGTWEPTSETDPTSETWDDGSSDATTP